MTLSEIKLISGHKSDTVAQKYIDQKSVMKQRASDELSIGGLQVGEDGEVLRKRSREISGEKFDSLDKAKVARLSIREDDTSNYSCSSNGSHGQYNIVFNYCTIQNYKG